MISDFSLYINGTSLKESSIPFSGFSINKIQLKTKKSPVSRSICKCGNVSSNIGTLCRKCKEEIIDIPTSNGKMLDFAIPWVEEKSNGFIIYIFSFNPYLENDDIYIDMDSYKFLSYIDNKVELISEKPFNTLFKNMWYDPDEKTARNIDKYIPDFYLKQKNIFNFMKVQSYYYYILLFTQQSDIYSLEYCKANSQQISKKIHELTFKRTELSDKALLALYADI